jgi:hypothetical protein
MASTVLMAKVVGSAVVHETVCQVLSGVVQSSYKDDTAVN